MLNDKMILGIGVDLVLTERIEHLMFQFKEKFAKRIFTQKEILKAEEISDAKRILFFAKRFAAKEAFSKALGLGIGRGIDFCDIEIYNDEMGKPLIRLLNGKEGFLKNHFNCENLAIHLSLSDEKNHASAYVIIEKVL
jgi:holo-[acyl-carrier protein] synthase